MRALPSVGGTFASRCDGPGSTLTSTPAAAAAPSSASAAYSRLVEVTAVRTREKRREDYSNYEYWYM